VYKVTKALKADPRYSTWVDIIRAKRTLPKFSELSDEAREFLLPELLKSSNNQQLKLTTSCNILSIPVSD
jgi:hypothetical protein